MNPSRRTSIHNVYAFTLLEVMVSLTIFSIATLGIANAFSNQISFNTVSERKTSAIAAAQLVLDRIRTKDPSALPSSGSTTETVTIAPRTFDVTVSYCKVSTYCTSSNIRQISLEVSYRGSKQISIDTVYSQLR